MTVTKSSYQLKSLSSNCIIVIIFKCSATLQQARNCSQIPYLAPGCIHSPQKQAYPASSHPTHSLEISLANLLAVMSQLHCSMENSPLYLHHCLLAKEENCLFAVLPSAISPLLAIYFPIPRTMNFFHRNFYITLTPYFYSVFQKNNPFDFWS